MSSELSFPRHWMSPRGCGKIRVLTLSFPPKGLSTMIASCHATLPDRLPRLSRSSLPAPAQRLAALTTTDQPVTDHALLVLLGHFAQHLGLVSLLETVPLPQKTVDHSPQTKLIEFLVAILAGLPHLQDLNR